MRSRDRQSLQRGRHHVSDLLIRDRPRRPRRRLVKKTVATSFQRERRRKVATITQGVPSRSAIAKLLMPSAASIAISARMASARPLCVT
jgi:hypothetical protein